MILSATKIKDYKSCKRLYELKYIYGLIPKKDTEALENGKSYHSKIEEIYKKGYFDFCGDKTDAMAFAYEKYVYSKFKMKAVEEWVEFEIKGHKIVGRVDGMAEDGCIVEHKTTSIDIEKYIYNLQWDEQLMLYMLAKSVNKIYYTICKKPTIRQKKNETAEEYVQRCCAWYDEEPENKIRVVLIERTQEELQEFAKQLQDLADEMQNTKCFYRCPCHCEIYGTRCVYSSVCLNYNSQLEYVDFIKKEKGE